MSRWSLLTFTAVALSMSLAAARAADPPTIHVKATVEAQILVLVNRERRARHLTPLRLTVGLRRAARLGSKTILTTGVFGHAADWEVRVRRRVRALAVAEALVWGTGTSAVADHLVSMWMASAPHRAILLDPDLRRVGIGATVGPFHGYDSVVMVTADLATAS
jgi:uncharacterized protein YkwD